MDDEDNIDLDRMFASTFSQTYRTDRSFVQKNKLPTTTQGVVLPQQIIKIKIDETDYYFDVFVLWSTKVGKNFRNPVNGMFFTKEVSEKITETYYMCHVIVHNEMNFNYYLGDEFQNLHKYAVWNTLRDKVKEWRLNGGRVPSLQNIAQGHRVLGQILS